MKDENVAIPLSQVRQPGHLRNGNDGLGHRNSDTVSDRGVSEKSRGAPRRRPRGAAREGTRGSELSSSRLRGRELATFRYFGRQLEYFGDEAERSGLAVHRSFRAPDCQRTARRLTGGESR